VSALEDAALAYAQQGLPVFPLQPNGKTPLTAHGLDDATTDSMTIETWWSRWPEANVAIRTGDLVVVDEDKLGAFEAFAQSIGETIPDTGIVRTASGRHFYFHQPEGQRIRNTAGKLAEGIDTRGDGGYVVAPPSIHPSGATYSWESAQDEAVTLPAWVADRLVRQQPERKPMPDIPIFSTTPYGKAALEQEIDAVATAAEGTRNHTLNTAAFALGQLVAGGEVEQMDAYSALEAAADASGLPATEASKTIRSGFQAGLTDPRRAPESNGAHPKPALRVVREAETKPGQRLIVVERMSAFRANAAVTIPFLIEDLWPVQSLGFIASPPKKGKTWLALSLAIAVASGTGFLHSFKATESRKILYLALEGNRRALLDRFGALCRGMNIDPESEEMEENFMWSYRPPGINLSDQVWADDLAQTVNEENVELVIVDVLRNAARMKENDASEFAALRMNLESTLRVASVGILHHFVKLSETSKERTPAERMSGTGAIYGALDVGMFITGTEDHERKIRIEFEGRDIAMPDPTWARLEGSGTGSNAGFVYADRAWWSGNLDEVMAEKVQATDSIIEFMGRNGGKARKGELYLNVDDASESTVDRRVRELVKLKKLFALGDGYYSLTPDGQQDIGWEDLEAAAIDLQHQTGEYGHPLADVIEHARRNLSPPPSEPQSNTENSGSENDSESTSGIPSDPTSTSSTASAPSSSAGTTKPAPHATESSNEALTQPSTGPESSASDAPKSTSTETPKPTEKYPSRQPVTVDPSVTGDGIEPHEQRDCTPSPSDPSRSSDTPEIWLNHAGSVNPSPRHPFGVDPPPSVTARITPETGSPDIDLT
jgi:hypothetical protein